MNPPDPVRGEMILGPGTPSRGSFSEIETFRLKHHMASERQIV
jgi:hypothetical protein